ncbi:MAG: Arm DNA-binding domain-containing protein, partial [Candidatus Thiodiazotropha sp. (ex Ustalcina ferruginea)]|nr:Arm DNA-binding domain-containing protein [Candidatus Thiodiazotropha sp. (ex Ustalcina ferruginea)]
MPIHKLGKTKVERAKPGKHEDGGGLILVVSLKRKKNWRLRLSINNKRREMGLGSMPDVDLDEA